MVAGDSPSPPRRQRRRPGGPLPVISDSLPYTSRVFRSPETEPKVARPISEQLASVFDPRQPSRRGEDSLDNSDISANQVKEGAQFAAHLGPDDPCDKRGERVLTGQQRSVARQSRRLSQSTIPSPVHDLRDNRQESLSQDRGNFSDVYKELYNSTSHAHSSRAMHDRPAVEKRSVEQPPGVNWSRTADWAAVQLSTSAEGHHDDQSTSSESTRHSRGSSYDSESALPDILPQFSERTLRKSPRTQQTIDSAQRHERRRPHRTDKQKILYGRHRARKLPIIRSSDSDSDSSDVDGDTDINEHATSNATSAKLHRISHCRPLPPFLGHSQLDPNTNLFDSGMAGQNPPALSLETSGEFSDNARCSGPKSSRKNRGACQLFLASISDTAFCEASTTYKRKAKNEIDHRKASKRRITTCAPPETIFIELEREQIWPNRRRRQPLIHSSTPTLELLRVDQVEDEAAPNRRPEPEANPCYAQRVSNDCEPDGSPCGADSTAEASGEEIRTPSGVIHRIVESRANQSKTKGNPDRKIQARAMPWSSSYHNKMQQTFDRRIRKAPGVAVHSQGRALTDAESQSREILQSRTEIPGDLSATPVNPLLLLPTPPAPRFRFKKGLQGTTIVESAVAPANSTAGTLIRSTAPSDHETLEQSPPGRPVTTNGPKLLFDTRPYIQNVDDPDWDPYAESQETEEIVTDGEDDLVYLSHTAHDSISTVSSASPLNSISIPVASRTSPPPLARRVTFSSRVRSSSMLPSDSLDRTHSRSVSVATTNRTPASRSILRRKTTSSPLRRCKTVASSTARRTATEQLQKEIPRQGSINKRGKLLRRMSTNPGFVWPHRAADGSVESKYAITTEDQGFDVHPSSHSFEGDSPSSSPSVFLVPPPAAQRAQSPHETQCSSGSGAENDSDELSSSIMRSLWRSRYAEPRVVAAYLPEYDDHEEPSFTALLQAAEAQDEAIEHPVQEPPPDMDFDHGSVDGLAVDSRGSLQLEVVPPHSAAKDTIVTATSDATEPSGQPQRDEHLAPKRILDRKFDDQSRLPASADL